MNKFIGVYKTENEYDWRECLILTYAIPTNSEYTEFDYENSLIVDLRIISGSVADFLRDLTVSTDATHYRTFMEFAATRKFRGKDTDVINELNNMGVIKKVPAQCVRLRFQDSIRGEYSQGVDEINQFIRAEIEKQAFEKTEQVPLTERVVRDERVQGNPKSTLIETLPVEKPVETAQKNSEATLLNEINDLKNMIKTLAEEVHTLKEKSTVRRARKPKSESGE